MGSDKGIKEAVEQYQAEARSDLAAGRVRVVNFCHTCPFADILDEREEKTNKPIAVCAHPATWAPPEPLKVERLEHGFIPPNCPLKVQPTTVFLDPQEES